MNYPNTDEMIDLDDVLNLTIPANDSGASTVGGYLAQLLKRVWLEDEGFSGKRPFGNSGWTSDLLDPLLHSQFVETEDDAYNLIVEVIDSCFE